MPADSDGASSSSTSMSEHIEKPDTIVVIAEVRRSPKMQYKMRCHVAGEAESEFYFKKPECEYNVALSVGRCRNFGLCVCVWA